MKDSYLLHIDTTGERGLVMLSQNGIPVASLENNNPMEHGSFLHPSIAELMKQHGIQKNEIAAIAVANGPGSYTGLRVGLSAAKGLCYVWNIPLITVSSLELLARRVKALNEQLHPAFEGYIVPMIDARRMEVFYAMYDGLTLDCLIESTSAVLEEDFLEKVLESHPILFTGNGMQKWKKVCNHSNAVFITAPVIDTVFAQCSNQFFNEKKWADLAYSQPDYSKEFYQQKSSKI